MAQTVVAATLTLDSQQATTSVKSFKTQLKEANASLIDIQEKFGETSDEALHAAKSVAELRDRLGDAKEIADAFNPDAKFQAFTTVLQGTAGGFAALTGAMALFGGESEDVQKALLKVQAALALSEGLNALGALRESFGILKIAAVEAFTAIKAAIGSTGIGLLVVALAAIVAYWDDIKMAVGLATTAQKENVETATKSYELEKEKLDLIQSQNNLYKQQGKTEQEILDIQIKQLKITNEAAENLISKQNIITDQAIKSAQALKGIAESANLGFLGTLFGDPVKIAAEAAKVNDVLKAEIIKRKDAIAAAQMEIIKSTNDFNQKIRSLNQSAAEAGITDQYILSQRKLKDTYEADQVQIKQDYTNEVQRNQLLAATASKYYAESAAMALAHSRELRKRLKDLADATANDAITDADILNKTKLRQAYDNDVATTKQTVQNATERNKILIALGKKYLADAKAIDDANLKSTKERLAVATNEEAETKKRNAANDLEAFRVSGKQNLQALLDVNNEIATMQLDAAGQQAAAQMTQLNDWYREKIAAVKGNEEAIANITREYERQKTQITEIENNARLSIIASVLGQAADLFGKATAAGKALAIAQTTIDTYQSATASYKALAGIPVVGPALGFAAAAVAVAAGLANVKRILSVDVPGGGGPSPSISSGASAPIVPSPQVSNTQLPQNQINQIGNATVRSFVVESDITNNQERIKRLNRQARLGG